MKTYTKEEIGNATILENGNLRVVISGETKCIYKGFQEGKIKGLEITKEEFEGCLLMNIGGMGYNRTNEFVKVIKEYTFNDVAYIVANIYIPGMMYEENIVHKADYLNDFEETEIEPVTVFK